MGKAENYADALLSDGFHRKQGHWATGDGCSFLLQQLARLKHDLTLDKQAAAKFSTSGNQGVTGNDILVQLVEMKPT